MKLNIGDFVQLNNDKISESGCKKVYVITSEPNGFEVDVISSGEKPKTVKRWDFKRCSIFGENPDTLYPAWMVL